MSGPDLALPHGDICIDMEASWVYERALGGPYVVRGMKGISFHKAVRTVHMTLDVARLRGQVVDMPTTDLAKYFDVIA